jgi:polyphosphate kinase 2 (PPK2 family)
MCVLRARMLPTGTALTAGGERGSVELRVPSAGRGETHTIGRFRAGAGFADPTTDSVHVFRGVPLALTFKDVRRLFQVPTRGRISLDDYDPGWAADKHFKDLTKDQLKTRAGEFLKKNRDDLCEAQERLYASDTHSVLIVMQASDAAGKDGTIKHVIGVNPQGCQVFAFKRPSSEELDHNFLWRYMKALPERGRIGIFNRSYYEDVLVVRVHPELIGPLPGKDRGRQFWADRYDDINAFERHLARNGTLVLKFFLNVFRADAAAHEHQVGAVVGDSRGPQMGDAHAGRFDRHAIDRWTRRHVPGGLRHDAAPFRRGATRAVGRQVTRRLVLAADEDP